MEKTTEKQKNIFSSTDKADLAKRYELIKSFSALKKALQMYGRNNEFVKAALIQIMPVLRYFFIEQNKLSIMFDGFDIIINGDRLKKKRKFNDYMNNLSEIHKKFSLREIIFFSKTSEEELLSFFELVNSFKISKTDANYFEAFQNVLRKRKLPVNIVERQASAGEEFFSVASKPQMARLVYRKMVGDLELFKKRIKKNKPLPVRKAVRHVQNLIDLLKDDSEDSQRSHLLVLSTLNSLNRQYLNTHMTNTAILALSTGITLGIDREYLVSVGIAAYLHDMALDLNEYEKTQHDHDELAFSYLSKLNSLNFPMMEAAMVSGNHHSTHSFEAKIFPRQKTGRSLVIAEEIVKVCDFYTILTTWWPHVTKQPLDRISAMEKVLAAAQRKIFVPVIARALFNTLGIYPPGTVVLYKETEKPAFSMGGLLHKNSFCKVLLLDDNLMPENIKKVPGKEIVRAPFQINFRLPPETIKYVFDYFHESEDDNENNIEN